MIIHMMPETQKFITEQQSPFSWKVPSNSEKEKFYNVSFNDKTNKWSCDCVAGSFNAECRHIRIIKNKLAGKFYKN